MGYLIGVDVGSTNVKVMAFDHGGRPAAIATARTPVLRPGEDRYEHDPDAIWQVVAAGIRQVAAAVGPGQVDAIAVASIAEEGYLLDAGGRALAPAIAWYDQRTVPQAARWTKHFGSWETYRITGLLPDSIYTLHKIMWIRAHQPEVYEQAVRWLCMSDYITYLLSGEQAMSLSLASHTMCLDLQRLTWSDDILREAGVPRRLLPDLVPSGVLIGRVTPDAAAATGLPAGTPVVTGGHDHVCGAFAAGALEPGTVLDSTGTAEALLIGLTAPAMTPQTYAAHIHFGAHALRGRFYAGSAMTSGPVLDWVTERIIGRETEAEDDLEQLLAEARGSAPGAEGLFFLPHMADVAFTDRDGWSRGALLGLQLRHTRGHVLRAVLEGLVFELRVRLETLERSCGLPAQERVVVSGGQAASELLLELRANILNRAVTRPACRETTALGAALLAGLGAGVYRDAQDALARAAEGAARVAPEPGLTSAYANLYPVYNRLFQSLADEWHQWPWQGANWF